MEEDVAVYNCHRCGLHVMIVPEQPFDVDDHNWQLHLKDRAKFHHKLNSPKCPSIQLEVGEVVGAFLIDLGSCVDEICQLCKLCRNHCVCEKFSETVH